MDTAIFKKLKLKPGMSATVLQAPEDYPYSDDFRWNQEGKQDFVHLFVSSQRDFEEYFASTQELTSQDSLFWLSYPKSSGKEKYDINRDSLWDLLLAKGWHPVAQVSLDEKWSAIRLKINEAGKEYLRPGNVKGR